ncbi:MAG: S-layer homology domain-containing protein [Anaerovoracaceae bacterium]|jgi:hypothetical protein
MKLFKSVLGIVLSATMILTGCFAAVPASFAADTDSSVTTQQAGPALVDYSVESKNVSPKTEEGEEFIVTLVFDQNLTTDRYTSNAFNIELSGRSLSDMGFANPVVTAEDNKLILDIKGTSGSTWTYYVSRTLDISLKSNYYEDIMNEAGTACSYFPDIHTSVPVMMPDSNGDMFVQTSYTAGSASSGTKESITFRMAGDATGRAANAIQILSSDDMDGNTIVGGSDTGTVYVHSHMFKTLTQADYVQYLANAFNRNATNYSTGYTMTATPDTDDPTQSTVTITADTASDTQTLANAVIKVFAYESPNDARYQQWTFNAEIAEAEARLETISASGYNKISSDTIENSISTLTDAIAQAQTDYNSITDDTTSVEYNAYRDKLIEAMDTAADSNISTDEATRNGSVYLTLDGGQDWIDNITEVDIDGTAVDSSYYTIDGTTLTIKSSQFQDPERTKDYEITVKSTGYADVVKDVTVYFYGAQTFQIRHLDANGKILKSKIYTLDEIKALSDDNDHYYHAICTMRGITAFKGRGVYLSTILKDAGIQFTSGMTAQLRTNDSVEESDTNDPTDENAYYWRGNFDYDWLMQDRYYFRDLYEEGSDFYNTMNTEGSYYTPYGSAKVTFDEGDTVRTAAGASTDKVADEPLIAYEYCEKSWNINDQTSLETEEYDQDLATDKRFRFLFGTALSDENGTTVSAPETTLWSVSYEVFGVDIIDGESTSTDSGSTDNSNTGSTTYKISQTEGISGGTVSYDKTTAAKGETVTVTAKANDGYTLDGITVKTATGATVAVSGSNGTYTFTMPAEDVIITGDFTEENATPTTDTFPFTDVAANRWSRSAVEYVYNNGIFAGTSATTFSPETVMNRAMFVTILYRMEGSPAVSGDSSFTDVASGQYYSDAVKWASDNGIVSGYDADTFGPNDEVTREQMAAIFYRYANYKNYDVSATNDLSSFSDASSVSSYATDAMKWAVGAGIISGMSDGTLQPQAGATREQTASIVQRFMQIVNA